MGNQLKDYVNFKDKACEISNDIYIFFYILFDRLEDLENNKAV